MPWFVPSHPQPGFRPRVACERVGTVEVLTAMAITPFTSPNARSSTIHSPYYHSFRSILLDEALVRPS